MRYCTLSLYFCLFPSFCLVYLFVLLYIFLFVCLPISLFVNCFAHMYNMFLTMWHHSEKHYQLKCLQDIMLLIVHGAWYWRNDNTEAKAMLKDDYKYPRQTELTFLLASLQLYVKLTFLNKILEIWTQQG